MKATGFVFLLLIPWAAGLIPPKFQWKVIEFAWESNTTKEAAVISGDYVPVHNMPTGLAKWKDKLFITIPRWKKGVPSSLNYISLNGSQSQPLNPYPTWQDAFVKDSAPQSNTPATVVSTFRIHVDKCDRLWVVDNGVSDMANGAMQVSAPALVIFDLQNNTVLNRFILPDDVLRDASVFTSVVVDIVGKGCNDSYAYITDMGSNAIVVYSMTDNTAWRIEHPHFNFNPNAGIYKVGGIDFYWNDGVSSVALSRPKKDGHRDLYLHPTSSTKQFKMSTKLLRNKNAAPEDIIEGVEIVGDRGPKSQSTACDFDLTTNVLFFTQVSKNGFGCWNADRPFIKEFTPVIMKDCSLMEFPNDIKVDHDGNLWVLSDRQARFLYEAMDFNQVNFRILTAPVSQIIQGTPCEKSRSNFCFFKRLKSK